MRELEIPCAHARQAGEDLPGRTFNVASVRIYKSVAPYEVSLIMIFIIFVSYLDAVYYVRRWKDNNSQCEGQQPQEHFSGDTERKIRRDNGHFRIRQVVSGIRHFVCRGAEAVCRESFLICQAVPRKNLQARCGPDRGHSTGNSHRTESQHTQSTLHHRHQHRDLRLSEDNVRKDRQDIFPGVGRGSQVPQCQ